MDREKVLDMIFDCYEAATGKTDADQSSYLDFDQRKEMLEQMRQAFPEIRIERNYSRIGTVRDCFSLVADEVAKRRKMLRFILGTAHHYFPREKTYGLDEEILSPRGFQPDINLFLKEMRFEHRLENKFGYFPGYYQVCAYRTPRGLLELFYWKNNIHILENRKKANHEKKNSQPGTTD